MNEGYGLISHTSCPFPENENGIFCSCYLKECKNYKDVHFVFTVQFAVGRPEAEASFNFP